MEDVRGAQPTQDLKATASSVVQTHATVARSFKSMVLASHAHKGKGYQTTNGLANFLHVLNTK